MRLSAGAIQALLAGVPCALAVATIALRRFEARLGAGLRIGVESALVLLVFALALAFQYLVLALVPLEAWAPFADSAWHAAALAALPVALVPGRLRGRALGVYLTLFVGVAFGDVVYLRYFGNVLPLLAFRSGAQLWDVRDLVLGYTRRSDGWLLPSLLAALLVAFSWPSRRPFTGRVRWVETASFLLLAALMAGVAWPVKQLVSRWLESERSYRVLNGTDAVQDTGYLVAHLKETSRALRSLRELTHLSPRARAEVQRFHEVRAIEPPHDTDFGIARGTNLLIVQVEGMQKWVIGTRHAGHEITPFLNQLRKRALYFENLFDETGDSSTSDAEYMLFNSQLPLSVGSVAFRRADNHFVTLLHVFKDAGYHTFAGHAYAAGMWNRAVLYPRYGFDHVAFQDEFGAEPKLGWGLGDKPFMKRAVPMLARLSPPFLGFLVTLTSHGPFQYVPTPERSLVLGAVENSEFGGYLHSMRYEDEAVELLFELLQARGLLDNTTVVIYGDHDSRMRFPAFQAEGVELSRDVLRRLSERDYTTKQIPLIVVLPPHKQRPAGSVRTLGGHIDVGPTLLYLYGLPRPRSFLGQSLLPEREGHALRIDGSAVDSHHIYVASNGGRCESFPELTPRPPEDCEPLARSARAELDVSWSVTLSDLASELAGKRPAVNRAERAPH